MAQIFISYNRRNLDAVKTLAHDLQETGNHVWFDQSLIGGQHWWDNILLGICKSDIFVFIITPESLESHACIQELTYASQLRKAILPILLSKVDTDLLPRPLSEIHYVDYQRQDRQAAFTLIKSINSISLSTLIPPPDPLPQPPPVPISYLNDLNEQINTTEILSFNDQHNLVSRLKEHLHEGRSPTEVFKLLICLKERRDLLARIDDEIDAMLVAVKKNLSGQPQKPIDGNIMAGSVEIGEIEAGNPIGLDRAAEETERILNRVLDHQESWVLEGDNNNYIVVNSDTASAMATVSATVIFSEFQIYGSGAKATSLEEIGWKNSFLNELKGVPKSFVRAIKRHGIIRGYFKAICIEEVTRFWPVANSRSELTMIASELIVALQKIAPGAKTVIVRKQ
jgi:hypothetical protein